MCHVRVSWCASFGRECMYAWLERELCRTIGGDLATSSWYPVYLPHSHFNEKFGANEKFGFSKFPLFLCANGIFNSATISINQKTDEQYSMSLSIRFNWHPKCREIHVYLHTAHTNFFFCIHKCIFDDYVGYSPIGYRAYTVYNVHTNTLIHTNRVFNKFWGLLTIVTQPVERINHLFSDTHAFIVVRTWKCVISCAMWFNNMLPFHTKVLLVSMHS